MTHPPTIKRFIDLLLEIDDRKKKSQQHLPYLEDAEPLDVAAYQIGFHSNSWRPTAGDLRALVQHLQNSENFDDEAAYKAGFKAAEDFAKSGYIKSGWQPISTAPTNKDILCLSKAGRSSVCRCVGDYDFSPEWTHWYPLPEPPASLVSEDLAKYLKKTATFEEFKSFPKDEVSPQNEPKTMLDLIHEMVSEEAREEQRSRTTRDLNPKTPCCNYESRTTYPVYWNEFNKVVQCHNCGHVYEPRTPSTMAGGVEWKDAMITASKLVMDSALTWFQAGETKLANELRMCANRIRELKP